MKPPYPGNLDSADAHLPPACAAFRELLQLRLDGVCPGATDASREHSANCADCKALADAGELLLSALPAITNEQPAAGFADRVMTRMSAEPARSWNQRPWLWIGGLTLAASVLIAVLAVINQSSTTLPVRESIVFAPPERQPDPPDKKRDVADKPVPLRDSLQEATTAVAALTRKATADNFGLRLPKWPNARMDGLAKVDPPPAAIQDVRQNAASGIAPITDSARRAVNVFWREFGPNMDEKPQSN
jgi:hypothetical protein